jgi:DNA-binding transcriptional MerR regulator
MKMQKRTFRIGELAKKLNLEKYVIRFWEKEFKVKTKRTEGSQRSYTEDDLALFSSIRDLLHNRGFTIAGAKQEIKSTRHSKRKIVDQSIIGSHKTTIEYDQTTIAELKKEKAVLEQRVLILQQQLIKLRELL